MKRIMFIGLFLLALLAPAWEAPVKIDGGSSTFWCEYTQVRFDYSGAAYVLYNYDPNFLKLAKYDGVRVEALGQVNKGSLKTYAPGMAVARDGKIHIVWAEATSRAATDYYIKYRIFDGHAWSDIIQLAMVIMPGTPQSKHAPPKIEFIRIAVDGDDNLFVAYYDSTRARSKFISKYDDVITQEGWPSMQSVRMKYPDVQAGDDYVHVVWQNGLPGSANYTCSWARRENKVNGKWLPIVDIKQNRNMSRSSHTPMVSLDEKQNPHFIYMDDGDGPGREVLYRYWTGTAISERQFLTPNKGWWSNNSLSMFNKDNGFMAGHKVIKLVYYDWKVNGVWKGVQTIDGTMGADAESADLSKDGKVAAVSYTTNWNIVWLVTSSKIVVNEVPLATFTADKNEIFWRDSVNFNASGSSDPDGSIVRYQWNFGDGESAEGSQVTHAFVNKFGDVRVKLTVTDDKGAMTSFNMIIKVKALYTAKNVTFEKKQIRTLLYLRDGYVIRWSPNESNATAGYTIVSYKIFRRVVGETGDYTDVGTVDVAKTLFADVSIEQRGDKTYEYSVCPMDADGHYSPVNHF